ncbi:MAG: hypothetical protein M3270_11450 [Thermoproteota archaeon]|nr:hypothetical protein [Thermoproteota archaeon]
MGSSTIENNNSRENNRNNNSENSSSKCAKCLSGDMIEHPSFLSIPLTSHSKIAERSKRVIEDQDADFVFRFLSCNKCGYSEFYLVRGTVGKRI